MAQKVKCLPAMQETWVRSLDREDLLEKAVAPHSSTLAWKIPWTEEPGRLQSMGLQSWTRLSDFPFTFHFHALEKEMATHSIVLAWRIPGTGEPGELDKQQPLPQHCLAHKSCVSCAQSLSRVQLCNPMDCSPPGSSVHGISQARILEWVAIPFSSASFQPRD